MAINPSNNHGEGNPEAAKRFNKAETRFVESSRGKKKIQEGAKVQRGEEAELEKAVQLGRQRAKGGTSASAEAPRKSRGGRD
jgi:hypothetical protein